METKGLAELLPPLSVQEALVEAHRCLFCYDAPCTHACPTHIDIPRFIKKIATDNLTGSARTILDSNLLGATCARVCPVEELCEGACVLGQNHRPVMIGRLQRYAMDHVYDRGGPTNTLAPSTGRSVAVIGAGPAGLSCAGELARRGHSVTIFEKRELGGGLSTYGIISLREPVEASLREVVMIERMGVKIETDRELGRNISFYQLREDFDAVFLGVGLGATQTMGIPGEELIVDGLDYIESSKLNGTGMKIGRNVVVVGAGNTAIDCAIVAQRLGAETVTMLYRRSALEMTAYAHEFEFIKKEGVTVRFLTQPVRVLADQGRIIGLECVRMELGPAADGTGRRAPAPVDGSEFVLAADQVVKAVGQQKLLVEGLKVDRGFIQVNAEFETSVPGLFAGGDCVRAKGSASTVMAVEDGKLAAAAIHRRIMAPNHERRIIKEG
ncbi:MAG TPA: NAD(P)-dependent oxidoreductase [Bryobacteraceae bacterium]|nr:NAD(P)-dependent oxidoreductase [Bryobacteraceae bacterium]